jgi:hypothetical protein
VRQHAEIIAHADRDQDPQHRQKFPLLEEVRLARFPDDLGNCRHRSVHRQFFRLQVLHPAVDHPDGADCQADHEDGRAAQGAIKERDRPQIRYSDVGFARMQGGRRGRRQSSGAPFKGVGEFHRGK